MAEKPAIIICNEEEETGVVPSHLFVELTSLAELSFPTTASSRIKYTCVCASPHILAVGSSSGTVYLFSRYAAKNRRSLCNVPVQVIPCQEGAITLVEISPDEKCVAVATSRGFICVLNISRNHSTVLLNNVLHIASEITCFRYSLNGSRLFAGDNLGRVSCSKLSTKLSLRSPCELILRLDSRVVQIDHFNALLLVSTISRCYLHNTARQTTCQIGSKLRNGIYGACFFTHDPIRDGNDPVTSVDNTSSSQNYSPLIFCARPGGRLWEVDSQGKVYSTHQFAGIRNSWGIAGFKNFGISTADNGKNITFGTVYVISEFILSASGRTLALVDPKRAKLVLAADIGEDIAQFYVCANDVFLLTMDGYLRKVTLFPLEKVIEKLVFRERYTAAAQVVSTVYGMDRSYRLRTDILRDIRERLKDNSEAGPLIEELNSIIIERDHDSVDVSKPIRVPQVARLASGIHKVVKGMENSGYEDDFTFRVPSKRRERASRERTASRSPYNSLTRRSKSTSSVSNFIAAGSPSGNSAFVDVPLDADLEKISIHSNDRASQIDVDPNYSAVMDSAMNISRSEESLVALLDNDRCRDYDRDDQYIEEMEQSKYPSYSHGNHQSMVSNSESKISNPKRTMEFFMETSPFVDDPLAINPTVLKETLKSGGKYLMEAVQKMSLLAMGPDFGDPAFLINRSNGYYDDAEDDGEQNHVDNITSRDVVFENFVPSEDATPTEEQWDKNPVVQRVVRPASGNRPKIRKLKTSKPNGSVMDGSGRPTDTSGINAEAPVRDQNGSGGTFGSSHVIMVDPEIPAATSTAKRHRCQNCGLHNMWRFLLTVEPFISRVDLAMDTYKDGGVPMDVNSWRMLLMEWKQRQAAVAPSASNLCLSCSQLMATLFTRRENPNAGNINGNGCASKPIHSILMATPDALLERIFGRTTEQEQLTDSEMTIRESMTSHAGIELNSSIFTESKGATEAGTAVARKDESPMAVSMYYNPLYESVYNSEDGVDYWTWLANISLDILLAIGTKVIGVESVIDLIMEVVPEEAESVSGEFYRLISSRMKCGLSAQVLENIALDLFNLDGVLSNDQAVDNGENRAIRIDGKDFCPCCTLPLTSVVAENDRHIYIFNCGHGYHKVCMVSHGKRPYSCLVCTLITQ